MKDIFQSISAKAGPAKEPCCDWVGDEGAGHYVKMVHNGIEYGDMQLICEAYSLMKQALGMTCDEMSQVRLGEFCVMNQADISVGTELVRVSCSSN